MRKAFAILLSMGVLAAHAQQPAATLDSLHFLEGTWTASTSGGSADATALGTYTFARDLGGHALRRTSSADKCTGPATFDCTHHDQLTVYPEGGILHALYIDSEGHVIHYMVTTPDANTAVFLSEGPAAAPHFRLLYHLEAGKMSGSFGMAAPGSTDFHAYLEWSGTKK